jgi:hypothetical protein
MEKQKYKNRFYEITTLLPVSAVPDIPVGAVQTGSVNIVNKPFIITRITSGIIGFNQMSPNFPQNVQQDYQYNLELRTDQYNYQTAPINAALMHGSGYNLIKLATPEELSPKTTVTIKITNTILRAEGGPLRIQTVLHGLEPIGEGGES